MNFKNTDELLEFFNKLDIEKSNFVFKEEESHDDHDCGCGGSDGVCQCETTVSEKVDAEIALNSNDVLVESFADSPSFDLSVSDVEHNTFYVKEFEAVPDACGTGRISLGDRIASMNMCKMNGVTTVNLDIVVEGKQYTNIPFRLQKTDSSPRIVISKEQLL